MERLQANVENLQKQLAVREREKTELANQRREEEMAHVDVCAAMNRTIDELRQSLAQVVGERDTIRATVQEWQETIKEIEVRKLRSCLSFFNSIFSSLQTHSTAQSELNQSMTELQTNRDKAWAAQVEQLKQALATEQAQTDSLKQQLDAAVPQSRELKAAPVMDQAAQVRSLLASRGADSCVVCVQSGSERGVSPSRARSPSPQRGGDPARSQQLASLQQTVAALEAKVAEFKALEADRQQLQQVCASKCLSIVDVRWCCSGLRSWKRNKRPRLRLSFALGHRRQCGSSKCSS